MDTDFSARAEAVPDAKRARAGACGLGEPARDVITEGKVSIVTDTCTIS